MKGKFKQKQMQQFATDEEIKKKNCFDFVFFNERSNDDFSFVALDAKNKKE